MKERTKGVVVGAVVVGTMCLMIGVGLGLSL